jgi:hypothetical protein
VLDNPRQKRKQMNDLQLYTKFKTERTWIQNKKTPQNFYHER